jgi:16S rRNA (guanine527-N7)-methyltransferase
MRTEFITALKADQGAFGLELDDAKVERLADYYDLVRQHNPLLHLVGPCSPAEFAIRHVLESLMLLEHLPNKIKFADVGTGAGLPAIPCLLVRDDLRATLIESKEKKTNFLTIAAEQLGIKDRAAVVNKQFQEFDPANCEAITCRALDRFAEKLPKLSSWSKRRPMLLFGGNNLRSGLLKCRITFRETLMPLSEQRYLFVTSI